MNRKKIMGGLERSCALQCLWIKDVTTEIRFDTFVHNSIPLETNDVTIVCVKEGQQRWMKRKSITQETFVSFSISWFQQYSPRENLSRALINI